MTDRSDSAGGDRLLPCPFCKKEPESGNLYAWCSSASKDCPISRVTVLKARWNTRASPPSGNAGEGAVKLVPPVCCYCDADLSCSKCGREQPADYTAPPRPAPDALREALRQAFISGAMAVHQEWHACHDRGEGPPRGDPEFFEAANDYALSAPVQSGVRGDREAIVRIIHGDDEDFDDLVQAAMSHGPRQKYRDQIAELYRKADAILSLQSTGDQRTPQVNGDES